MLKFSKANAKLDQLHDVDELQHWLQDRRKVYSFDLLSGYSCPQAKDCLSKVVQIDGKRKIKDGKDCQFRCFSASQEVVFPAVYDNRKANFDGLKFRKSSYDMACAIADAMPANLGICRIHVAGDFFNNAYFKAWMEVARLNPDRLFYAYTKSLPYWVDNLQVIPDNLILTASYGGRRDDMIVDYGLRSAKVVFSYEEADMLGLEVDHDDTHAANPFWATSDFALIIHGIQPKGSEAADAIKQLK